jgi:hypothetical protein
VVPTNLAPADGCNQASSPQAVLASVNALDPEVGSGASATLRVAVVASSGASSRAYH